MSLTTGQRHPAKLTKFAPRRGQRRVGLEVWCDHGGSRIISEITNLFGTCRKMVGLHCQEFSVCRLPISSPARGGGPCAAWWWGIATCVAPSLLPPPPLRGPPPRAGEDFRKKKQEDTHPTLSRLRERALGGGKEDRRIVCPPWRKPEHRAIEQRRRHVVCQP